MITRRLLTYTISTIQKVRQTLIQQPKNPRALQLPVFKTKLQQLLYIKPYALSIMQQIQLYIQQPSFKKKFQTNYLNMKYTWICIHTWLVLNRLKNNQTNLIEMINAIFISRSMKMLLQQFTRDYVYQYSDNFNLAIYNELLRMQGTIFWSLDDYYVYKHYEKPFKQIFDEDMGYENIEVMVNSQQIQKYMEKSIQYLKQFDAKQLLSCEIKWESNIIL